MFYSTGYLFLLKFVDTAFDEVFFVGKVFAGVTFLWTAFVTFVI